MKILKMETKDCPYCTRQHPVATMAVKETNIYKGVKVSYEAVYEYCGVADEWHAVGDMISENYHSMVEAYQKAVGGYEPADGSPAEGTS